MLHESNQTGVSNQETVQDGVPEKKATVSELNRQILYLRKGLQIACAELAFQLGDDCPATKHASFRKPVCDRCEQLQYENPEFGDPGYIADCWLDYIRSLVASRTRNQQKPGV